MARAVKSDPYHNFRYQVKATKAGALDPLGSPLAGFSACSIPDQSLEIAEYKEGTMVYSRKFPGNVKVSDITLSRGVASNDTEFWAWINQATKGGEYRIDLEIHQFHRTDVTNQDNFANLSAKRIIKCLECLPMHVKVGSDMESTANDVSIQELGIAMESFSITNSLTSA